MEWQALHYTRRATESRNPFRYRFLGRRPLVPVGAGEGGMWRGDPCGRPSSFHRQRRGRPQGSPPFPSPPPPLRGRSRFPCLFAKNLYLRGAGTSPAAGAIAHVSYLLCRISSLPKILILIVSLRTYYWKNALEEVLGCVHTQTYLLAYG